MLLLAPYNAIIFFAAGLICGSGLVFLWAALRMNKLRKERDAAQKHAREAQAAIQDRRESFRRVSHDIRTPVNAIVGLAGLLEQGVDPARQREFLHVLKKSATHLLEITTKFFTPAGNDDARPQERPEASSESSYLSDPGAESALAQDNGLRQSWSSRSA